MKFDRAGQGNKEGIKIVQEASDPLERHTFMIPKSMIKRLETLVFNSKKKTNKSKLVREALENSYL